MHRMDRIDQVGIDMTTDEGINYDRSFLGKEFPIGTFEISRDMILEFSQVSGEVNPIYVDETLARESEYGDVIAPPRSATCSSTAARSLISSSNSGISAFSRGRR